MKKPFVALLLLVGAAAMVANMAYGQDLMDPQNKLVNAKMSRELLNSRAQKLRVSAGGDPDTVWFGHSYTDHWNASSNYWNLYTGNNFPGTTDPTNALWDWDNSSGLVSHGIGDSLQGWWPYRRAYSIAGGLTLPDVSRPWWAIDIGNQANYVMNAGPGGKRTKGVIGMWHGDPGNNAGTGVTWTPLSGSRSAWCGLRELADPGAPKDLVTGNPFDASVLEFNSEAINTTPTNKRFPGYTSQMDQMMYRDLTPSAGQPVTISFLYRTRLSTAVDNAAATRVGWFHGDPLAVTSGNFISSTDAGAAAPMDSFMVYVGVPVNDAACVYSDGVTRPVYDAQRRWFSEVLRIFEGPTVPYYEILSAFGNNPADTTSNATATVVIPAVNVDAIRNAPGNTGNKMRLVFRVKTNSLGSDTDAGATGFTSQSRGAAMIDNVTVNASTIGDFEGAEQSGTNSIDNRTTSSSLLNWKTTGKPPAIYFHLRSINDLTYNDLCGPPTSAARFCNIFGSVLSANNFDDGEKSGDSRFLSDREVMHGIISPTINFITNADSTIHNSQGLNRTMVDVTDDYYIWYDMYAGQFNLQFSGNAWTFGAQSYPAVQPGNGAKIWGNMVPYGFQVFNPEPQCFQDIEGLNGSSVIGTSNASGVPDSVRIMFGVNQQCFRFAISLGCNSSDGAYFDNVSLGFVDIPAAAQVSSSNALSIGTVATDIWQFINDAFPVNETPGLPGTVAYDTTTAVLKGGINNAQSTGNALRFDIPADTIAIRAANATGGTGANGNKVRLDMVFRILPGPGNYKSGVARSHVPGSNTVTGTLLQVPTNQGALASSNAASTNFWEAFLGDNGVFGTGAVGDGVTAGPGHPGGVWDPTRWNSARCDTVELNRFPVTGGAKITLGVSAGVYMNTYHEADPKFNTLGYNKFRCFMVDTLGSATQTNLVCDGTVPAWLTTIPQSRTGWNGSNVTKEFTKIIPDGLLTPGSHVQYFFRKSAIDDPATFVMVPDTTAVTPQNGESSTDGHRWQQFSVLPDRWKNATFGGAGSACMLYVDFDDRRGNERVWASVMDSLGGTAPTKYGAYNGWHATGVHVPSDFGLGASADPTITVVGKNDQPGTTWDMYGVKASESLTTNSHNLGNRYAVRAGMGLAAGKYATTGPTKEVLRTYYRVLAILTGDLNSGIFGPFANRSQDEITLLNDFLLTPTPGTAQPRGLFIAGDGFVQAETQTGGVDPSHTTFLTTKLGLSLRNGSYQSVSANTNNCADLVTTLNINTNKDIYGVGNSCLWSNDLLQRNPAITEAVEASFYENVGVNGPYTASVLKPTSGTRPWIALTDGFEIRHVWSRYCDTNQGRLAYYFNTINKVFGTLCTLTGTPTNTVGVPQNQHGAQFVNFMKVGNSVMRAGNAKIHFGLASSDHVKIKMFDVTGRQIRTLADRSFNAGEYDLAWDGTDDTGNQVARGVYFARIEYATKGTPINGRVVVLR